MYDRQLVVDALTQVKISNTNYTGKIQTCWQSG